MKPLYQMMAKFTLLIVGLACRRRVKEPGEARIAADRAIARFISTEIDDRMREDALARNNEAAKSTITETTFVSSQAELFALKYSEPWKAYEPRLRREEQVILDIYRAAEKESDPIRRFAVYRCAQDYYRRVCAKSP